MNAKTNMRTALTAAALLAAAAGCSDDPHQPDPPPPGGLTLRFEQVPYETELSYITDLAFAPDDAGIAIATDLYGGFEVLEMTSDRANVLLSGMLDDVFAEYDAGLLSVAIDPGFSDNGFFYLAANVARNHVLVRRYTLDLEDAAATVDSAQVILDLEVASSPRWHNISAMGFDEDGVMWMLVGDKGLSLPDQEPETSVAQDPSNMLGALVRLAPSTDPDMGGYTVPASVEPYSGDADPAVVTIGIRSPWKGVYHEGRWIYGDVGLDDVEEINIIDGAGLNMGWPLVEGPCADDIFGLSPDCGALTDPFIHYGRSNSDPYVLDDLDAVPTNKRSVYAGWVYRPREDDPYDGRWNDVLVWGDAFVGFMRAAPLDEGGESWHLGHASFPSAWAQGPEGYVYMVALSEEPSGESPEEVSGLPSPLHRAVLND